MNEKQQTAVQWLMNRLSEYYPLKQKKYKSIIEKALAMEREQIVNAHLTGLIYPLEMSAGKQAEQYFTDTYQTT